MMYLDYSCFRKIVDEFFQRFGAAPELTRRPVNRDCGYFDIVSFFGEQAHDPSEIALVRRDGPFNFSDDRIACFADEMAASLQAEGRLHSGPPAMKLVDAQLQGPHRKLIVQPCQYGRQAGSCFALDARHELFDRRGGFLRDYYLEEYPSRATADNPLAICLGVSAMVTVGGPESRETLVVRRSPRLASLESSFGASVAGSVDYPTEGNNLLDLIRTSLAAEASEELGLAPTDYELIPLAYAREVFRGERPQLFAALITKLTKQELSRRLDGLDQRTREFDHYEFLPLHEYEHGLDRRKGDLNHEGRMNLELLRQYLAQSR